MQVNWQSAYLAYRKPCAQSPSVNEPGAVAHTCDPSTWWGRGGKIRVQALAPQLHSEFKAALGYERLCLKKGKKNPKQDNPPVFNLPIKSTFFVLSHMITSQPYHSLLHLATEHLALPVPAHVIVSPGCPLEKPNTSLPLWRLHQVLLLQPGGFPPSLHLEVAFPTYLHFSYCLCYSLSLC